jgi:sulfite reductase (NADPH) hemoprotein beta-component
MASVTTSAQAVARIAYVASDVVLSVQPSLQADSLFSNTLHTLAKEDAPSVLLKGSPEVTSLI